MTPTDTQLKQALAKMLPEQVKIERAIPNGTHLYWENGNFIKNTELLHLCWLVEQELIKSKTLEEQQDYHYTLRGVVAPSWAMSASWQQRTTALAKVKGIEIV